MGNEFDRLTGSGLYLLIKTLDNLDANNASLSIVGDHDRREMEGEVAYRGKP